MMMLNGKALWTVSIGNPSKPHPLTYTNPMAITCQLLGPMAVYCYHWRHCHVHQFPPKLVRHSNHPIKTQASTFVGEKCLYPLECKNQKLLPNSTYIYHVQFAQEAPHQKKVYSNCKRARQRIYWLLNQNLKTTYCTKWKLKLDGSKVQTPRLFSPNC